MVDDISKFTKEDLQDELERREVQEMIDDKPIPLEEWNRDFSKVRKACETHIQELMNGEVDTDAEHYIYETAMEAFYGKDVWDWVNKMLK